MTNKNVAIKGDGTPETGKRIINYLEGLGGVNSSNFGFVGNYYYSLDGNGHIGYTPDIPLGYELATLPEPTPEKTFPREMWVWDDNELRPFKKTVIGLFKDRYVVDVYIEDHWAVYKHAREIDPPKPLTTDEKIADLQKQIDELKNMMK